MNDEHMNTLAENLSWIKHMHGKSGNTLAKALISLFLARQFVETPAAELIEEAVLYIIALCELPEETIESIFHESQAIARAVYTQTLEE